MVVLGWYKSRSGVRLLARVRAPEKSKLPKSRNWVRVWVVLVRPYHHHHHDDDDHHDYHRLAERLHVGTRQWDLDRCGGADDAWNAPSIDGSLVWFARSSVVVLVVVVALVVVALVAVVVVLVAAVDVRVAVGMVASTAVALRPRTRTSGGMAGSLGPSWTIFLSFRQCGLFWNPSSWLVPHGRSSVFPFPNQCNKDDPSTMMDRTVVALRFVALHLTRPLNARSRGTRSPFFGTPVQQRHWMSRHAARTRVGVGVVHDGRVYYRFEEEYSTV